MSPLLFLLAMLLVFGGMFGLIAHIERLSRAQEQSGRPSLLIRFYALAVGLAGVVFIVFFVPSASDMLLIPIAILIGAGVFGLLDALLRR